VPVVYSLLDEAREWVMRRRAARQAPPA
jgi:hypothetical protein